MISPGVDALLAELPTGVRAVVDTTVFAGPKEVDSEALRRLAALTKSHVVAYDLRVEGDGLPLCTVVGQAYLGLRDVSRLHAAERDLPPWIALVAYARPAELRHPEDVLVQVAAAVRTGT